MKKIIVLILIVFLSGNAFAQFSFGIAGNYTASLGFDENWNFDIDRLNFKNKPAHGFSAGIFLRTGKRFFFQPEVMYNFMTTNSTIACNETNSYSRKIYHNTISVPLLLGIKMVRTDFFNLRLMVGPRFRFDVGSKSKAESTDNITTSPRKWQLGLEAGLGFDLGRVTIDTRYNLMQDVFAYKYLDNPLKFSPINSFSVGIGVKLADTNPQKKYIY